MDWDHEIDLSVRKLSARLIIERALVRGWNVCGFKSNSSVLILYPEGRQSKGIKIFSASPPQISFAASKVAKDKYITNCILSSEGIPVPNELLVRLNNPDNEEISAFINEYETVVVKPLDASHGNGITVGVNSSDKLRESLEKAKNASKSKLGIIQQQVEGIDIRILCIDYAFVSSITRTPASVIGDGFHSIRQLIELENQKDYRGENYSARLNVISIRDAEEYLGNDKINSVPLEGELVRVMGVSNVGKGGEALNITDKIPQFLKTYAEKIALSLDLPVCGVDFMVKQLPDADAKEAELNPYVIEANGCPMLTMYSDPYSAEQLKIIDAYLDLVGKAVK